MINSPAAAPLVVPLDVGVPLPAGAPLAGAPLGATPLPFSAAAAVLLAVASSFFFFSCHHPCSEYQE